MSSYMNLRRAMESDYGAMQLPPVVVPKPATKKKCGRRPSNEFRYGIYKHKNKNSYEYFYAEVRYQKTKYNTSRKTYRDAYEWIMRKKAELLAEDETPEV